jgi:glutamine cyclotransferase
MRRPLLLLVAVLALVVATPTLAFQPGDGYTIVGTYPHDENAYTQGFDFWKRKLFEGTGLYGESTLRRVSLLTGEVLRQVELDDKYFGEGIAIWGDRVYQLTFREEVALVYERATFERKRTVSYKGEGWGLTHNGRRLVMSNGSDKILFRHPKTFKVKREIEVTFEDEPVSNLNELEWVKGEILANQYATDYIYRISPSSGEVIRRYDLTALHAQENTYGPTDVLNGIAYQAPTERLFITGKNWRHVYEIRLEGVNDSRR